MSTCVNLFYRYTFPGGANTTKLYLEDESIGAYAPKELKGKYDCWMLVKAEGPLYVDGSTKKNKVYLSRILLVPVK